MAENSYLSMFADPSSDMFSSSLTPLTPNDDGGFMLLQPNIVTPVSASTYQPVESESTTILTLGETSNNQPRSHPGMPNSSNTGATFTQLGMGSGSGGNPGGPYGFHPSQFAAAQASPHSTHRYPTNVYYNPGSIPSSGYPPQQSQPQRFGQDPYRQPQYPGYGGMMGGQNQGPSQGPPSNLPSAGASAWSQQQPPSHSYMGQVPPMRHPYTPGYGASAPESSQQQYLQSSFSPMGPGMVPRQMVQGYPPHLSMQQPFANTGQYGYPSQQPPGLPQQNRIPGMPYSMPQSQMSGSRFPQQSPQQMQQPQRPPGSYQSSRPEGTQFSPPLQKSSDQKPQPTDPMASSPRSAPTSMSPSPLASLSQLGPPDHKSPESPSSRPQGLATSSPLPPMFQHHPPQPPQQSRMPYPPQPQNQPGMMGPPGMQRPQQSFGQGPPTSSNGMYNGQPPYQNGANLMHQGYPGSQPQSAAALGNEIMVMKNHLHTYINSNQRTPEVDKKILEIQSKISMMQNQQQQLQQQQQGQGMRMPYPQGQQPNGNGLPPPGMMNSQPQMPVGGMMKRGVDSSSIPRPNMNIHVSNTVHNGYPFNSQNGQSMDSSAHSPKNSQDSNTGDLAISSQDTDDEGNKYATPKKKRNRNRSSTGRKRKAPPSTESQDGMDGAEGSPSKPSRSRNRPSQKKATPTKSNFQFGKKKKKQAGSDDDGDDLDATPPPSPPVVEPDFDGNYVEKRRSGRVTKRTKYIDDVDLDEEDATDAVPVSYPVASTSSSVDDNQNVLDGSNSATCLENVEPPSKSFFVQPGDAEPVVVEKIMSHRMGKRPIVKDIPENPDGEKAKTPDPELNPEEFYDVEEFHVKLKSYSYLHCSWYTAEEMEMFDKRIRQKVVRYKLKKETSSFMEEMDDEDFNPEYTVIERILDEKDFQDVEDTTANKTKKYYLCKWTGLNYDECSWELEQDCDHQKVLEFRNRQVPPPVQFRKRVSRPSARDWTKMDKASTYKAGNTLRDYQLEGVNWLLFCWYQHQNCILADEMGLGKTVQSTVFLEHIRRFGIRGPFLVVVPLSTLGNWAREVETWTDMNGIVYHGGSVARDVIKEYEFYYRNEKGQNLGGIFKFDIFITTYEILLSDVMELRLIEWRAIVIDEAHRLKNKNCKLLEGLKLLDVEHRVLLTGTPLQNNVEELFSLLNFLEPERFSNVEAFSADFGDLKTDDQVTKLQNILKPMMLRRLKEDVEKSIAPKEETIIEVELTNMQKKWYRAILEKNFTFLQKGTNTANVPNLMNTMMELRKCCNHPYLLNGAEESIIDDIASQLNMRTTEPELLTKALVQASGKLVLIDKLLPKLKDGGHKVLIFSQMVRCLDILEDYLVQKRYLFERIDGRIRGPDRQAAIDRFSREDSDRFVFLLCTRAGGLGINLTAADTVIIFDSDWNPQNDLQAQARCHRIGQEKSVKVYRLITRNSYEREMFDKASLKLGLDKAVLQSSQLGSSGRDAYAAAQQPLSKSDIEDLLKRGAYGALMDDDAAADQFCTEDIDQILQRRTQTVQLEAGEKGSTFSKASFAATGTRDDIDINDPDFWQKWAKKAEVSTDKDAFENDLIIHETRRRVQVKRYGEEMEDEAPAEGDSDDSYDSEDEDGKGRRGRRGRKGGKKSELEAVRIGTWQRMECLKLEKQLLIWGWGRWKEILKHSKFKRPYAEKDVEVFARTLVHYCCKQYSGSDEKAKPYVWSLVLGAFTDDWKARKANLALLVGKDAAVEDEEEASGSRSRKAKRSTRKAESSDEPGEGDLTGDMPDWDKDTRYDPEKLLDVQFLKHMKKHSVNRLVLRLKLLQNLKEEAILELDETIMNDTSYEDIPVELPPSETNDRLTEWWDDDSDKCLLIGIYKHGYEAYSAMRNDPKLCFLAKCGPSTATAPVDDEKEPGSDGDVEPEEVPEAESTDADAESETPKRGRKKKKDAAATPKAKPGRGRKPASAKRQLTSNGQVVFPSDADLNTRFRRLMVAYEKKRLRAEQLEQKKAQRMDRQLQIEKERELRKQDLQQKKWSRREEAEFLRVATIFGVEAGEDKDSFEWERFREMAKLDRKLDRTLSDYYRSFYQMLRKVCEKKLSRDEDELASLVEDVPEDKARRCLLRIELLNKIRQVVLVHPKLEERLKLCQPATDLPTWWIVGQHDRELLEGAAKYGINDTACNIAVDPDYSFGDCIKTALTTETKKSSKMESILKRETKSVEKPTSPKSEEKPVEQQPEDTDEEGDRKLKIESDEEDKSEPKVQRKSEDEIETDEKKEEPEVVEKMETDEKIDEPDVKKTEDDEEQMKLVVEAPEKKKDEKEKTKRAATPSTSSIEEPELTGELTVAQLLAKGMYAKGWPSDRIVQARLEHVAYCIEHNRWPSKRTQAVMYGSIPDDQAIALAAQQQQQAQQQQNIGFPENFMDADFALLAAAAGHIPGLNGVEPRRRRGRRPKAEVEAERIAQFHAAQAALLAQQQALMQAATAKSRRQESSGSGRSSGPRPPPAHQKPDRNDTDNEQEGVLDLTGKSKPSTSGSSSFSPSRRESQQQSQPEKGSKLSQKVDTLLKKRKQETQIDLMDPNCRIPVINMIDGSLLKGDKAPKQKDIQSWLMEHPNYVVDTTAFAIPGMFPDMSMFTNGATSSSSKRTGQDSPTGEQNFLTGEEHVTVVHRKSGKKISDRKAPQLKNLAVWLDSHPEYDIDPTWTELLREHGAIAAKGESSSSSSSKRGRKSNSDALAASASMFSGSPFAAGFGMGPGGMLPGFPRLPFGFPGMPGFPGLSNALMGLLPGMGGDSDSTKGESSSSSKKDRSERESSGKETSSSRKQSKADKQSKAEQAQQQATMESMMQSQLPFIFPQANMFGGMHPFLSQGFPGMPAGFPFGMPGLSMNGFGEAPSPSEKSEKSKEKRRRQSSPSERSEPSSSSSRRKTPVEKVSKVREDAPAPTSDDGDDE